MKTGNTVATTYYMGEKGNECRVWYGNLKEWGKEGRRGHW